MSSFGPLVELSSRLADKREEIETYSSRIMDLHKNNRLLREEELTIDMVKAKQYLKEVWDKNF
jgi:hypothetical protein